MAQFFWGSTVSINVDKFDTHKHHRKRHLLATSERDSVGQSHAKDDCFFFVYCVAAPVTNLDHMCRHNLDIKNMVQDENDIVKLYYIHQN